MSDKTPPAPFRRVVASPIGKFDDSIANELRYAGDREQIKALILKVSEFVEEINIPPEYRKYIEFGRAVKRDFAQRLSTALAQKIANGLRPRFKGILPDERGDKHESRSGSASGFKKLDVNFSNPTIGLGLGVSIKTLNFHDEATGRFTKNIKRLDGELRAEAQDYHVRQPFAVLAALTFFPDEASSDSERKSSLRHAWEVFRSRAGRNSHFADASLFERFWLCLYNTTPVDFGLCQCYDIRDEIPFLGPPKKSYRLSETIEQIGGEFVKRNKSS